jgi:Uma2 family endonuclease
MAVRTDLIPESLKLTYEDYVTLPDDGRRYEILDGELAVSPSPTSAHQLVSHNLELALSIWVRTRSLGRIWHAPLDLILAPTVVLQPDIFFISNARSSIVTKRGVEGAPDLVIEILSDSTAARDRGVKMHIYARHGVPRYWIIDVDATSIEAFALRDGVYQSVAMFRHSDVAHFDVPEEFELCLGEIWPAPGAIS